MTLSARRNLRLLVSVNAFLKDTSGLRGLDWGPGTSHRYLALVRQRWFSPRALFLHLLAIIVVPGCFVAMWWQVHVALSGNDLGYLYSVEWPIFGVLAVAFWWSMIHTDPATTGAKGMKATAGPVPGDHEGIPAKPARPAAPPQRRRDEEDEELRAYNDYLAGLRTERKTWRNPTGTAKQ